MLDLDAFGAMLREVRERKGLRPIDLALAMRWSGTAPVYRYERGGPNTPRPDPDTVNLFAQVLELDYADRISLLGFAGHIPDTEPFSIEEERRLLDTIHAQFETMPEPMLVFDYQWRIRAMNRVGRRLSGLDLDGINAWRRRGVTTIDQVWDPELRIGEFEDFETSARYQLLRFKLFNRLRRHEAWYRTYPENRSHYEGFVELWQETDDLLLEPLSDEVLTAVSSDSAPLILPTGERLTYEASQRNIHGAYGLLGILALVPLNDETRAVFDRLIDRTPSE